MELHCRYLGYVYEDSQEFSVTVLSCAVFNCILTFPTFFLNLSVFIATLRCKDLPDVTRAFFLNLALADLLTACFSQFGDFIAFLLLSLTKSPCIVGEFTMLVSFTVISVSFLTSICVAFERYISVMYPFIYSIEATRRKAVICIVFMWAFSTGVVLPCVVKRTIKPFETVASFGVVSFELMSIICYARVYLVARSVRRQIRAEESRFNIISARKEEYKLLFTTCLIVFSFFCCYFPFQLVCLFSLFNVQGIPSYFVYWAWTIANVNAMINPLITCWQLSTIRNRVMSSWKRQTNNGITVMTVKSLQTKETCNE